MASASEAPGPIEANVIINDIRIDLECPVCQQVPRRGPIHQCHNGHSLCADCFPRTADCPMCRVPLGNIRSLISEKIVARIPHRCQFADKGCPDQPCGAELDGHEKDCDYRIIRCADLMCKTKGPLRSLIKHIGDKHEKEDFIQVNVSHYASVIKVDDATLSRETMWTPDHIVYEGHHFFREFYRTPRGMWYAWVYMVGSHKACEEYVYTLDIFGEEEEGMSFRGSCVPMDVSLGNLPEISNCLTFTDVNAMRYRSAGKMELNYRVRITRKEVLKKMGKRKAWLASSESICLGL